MSPPSISKANVKFPIFAATFAQNNPAILVVGGGGGAGRSGVPNAICAFDTSSRAPNLEPFTKVDLSRDEDSVTSVAAVSTREGCILYAGINSSEQERIKGQNSHLRAFELTYPRKEDGGKIEFLSKTQLLTASSETARREGYQRVVRLSPPSSQSGGKRIGVIASSLQGEENELVTFPAVSTKPAASDIIQRIPLKGQEINDVDVFLAEDGHFQVAYCLDASVHVQRFTYDFDTKKTGSNLDLPQKRYEVPYPDVSGKKGRPKIRALRWLSSSHLLLLINLPNRSGVELQILKLYSEDGMGLIILRKRLGSGAKQAVDMDVARLNADAAGAYQCAIAVATQDVSLHIYTIDYDGRSLSGFAQYSVYQNVHDVQMTKAVWSPFTAPSNTEKATQFLRLATTSLAGSVSVETFELQPVSSGTRRRFVLISSRNRKLYNAAIYAACAFIIAMLAVMVQSLVDPQGNLTKSIIPASLQNAASGYRAPGVWMEEARRAKAVMDDATAPVAKTSQRIRDLLHLHRHGQDDAAQKALIITHDPKTDGALSTEVHEASDDVVKKHTEAKRWEELSPEERKRWKDKLAGAGMWAAEEGTTILKGIFFSEAGALVGQVAQGVMNG